MHLYLSDNLNPAFHLALEETLFSGSEDEYLLFYINLPSVIIGCNQVLQNEVNADYCRLHNIGVYRRMSGGGTVFHDAGNLNYSFIVNKTSPWAGMGGQFLHPIIHALHQLGVSAFQGKRKDLWIPGDFKISGTASHLKGMREMHHGTLLFNSNLEQLKLAIQSVRKNPALKGVASVPSPVLNIGEFMCEQGLAIYDMHDFTRSISEACGKYCESNQIENFPNHMLHKVSEIADLKYTSEAWNLRK